MCLSNGIGVRIMTEFTAFSYRHGSTWIHELDVRIKLTALVLFSISSIQMAPMQLMILISLFVWTIPYIGLSFVSVLKELRFFLILLAVILITRLFFASGGSVYFIGPVALHPQGLMEGGVICLRLVLIVLLGLNLIATTRTLEIKRAVEQLFRVKVRQVNVSKVHGKVKRLGKNVGRRSDWKKALVSLEEGQRIDFFEGA